jgi:hypothetical protein
MSHVNRHMSHTRWHAVIDAVKIMKLSADSDAGGGGAAAEDGGGGAAAGGGGVAAAARPPQALQPPATPLLAPAAAAAAAPVGANGDLVGIGLVMAKDMTVIPSPLPMLQRFVTHWQVLNVNHGGAAWANGQIFKGDKLMAVDGTLVTG